MWKNDGLIALSLPHSSPSRGISQTLPVAARLASLSIKVQLIAFLKTPLMHKSLRETDVENPKKIHNELVSLLLVLAFTMLQNL